MRGSESARAFGSRTALRAALIACAFGATSLTACGDEPPRTASPKQYFPPPRVVPSATASAAPDPTCGGTLVPQKDAPAEAPRKSALVPLKLLIADPPDLLFSTKLKPIDSGDVRVVIRPHHPGTSVDISRVLLARDVPREGLPSPVRADWDAYFAIGATLVDLHQRRMIAERAAGECKGCMQHACIDDAVAALKGEIKQQKASANTRAKAAVEVLEPMSRDRSATPPVLLADGWLLESMARSNERFEDITPLLRRPLELYARASAGAPPSDPVGLAARYRQATALEDAHRDADALAVWRALGTVDSPLRAEALYRAGSLEVDSEAAIASLVQARDADKSAEKSIAFAAMVRALGLARATNKTSAALDAAVFLSRYPSTDDDTAPTIAQAIDDLAGAIPESLAVPRELFAKAAMLTAKSAEDRADRPRAERIWRLVVQNAPNSAEAQDASSRVAMISATVAPEDKIRTRLHALAISCRPPLDRPKSSIEIAVQKFELAFKPEKIADPTFAACIESHAKWFLRDPDPIPPFKATIVVEVEQNQ